MHAHFSAKIMCSHQGLASLHFEIPRRLAPGLKKPAVNIKEIPRNARIKFSFFL